MLYGIFSTKFQKTRKQLRNSKIHAETRGKTCLNSGISSTRTLATNHTGIPVYTSTTVGMGTGYRYSESTTTVPVL